MIFVYLQEKDAKEGKVKKDKEKPAEKSLIVLDVKPWEADTDLEVFGLLKEAHIHKSTYISEYWMHWWWYLSDTTSSYNNGTFIFMLN